ncbi:MAG: hypothetical protein KJO41_12890 [Bacteroidia bacterium]|nr:hypothetical protein [Bacteroidia bacterium]NND26654.1 hypothetical protein [Flavobacteriaceae bacterium]MBT8279887.1 hypothetical protein [Bacteroidia bacterium]NNK60701.1 hypothetical protein [Flavobacteriaceae bacterium]NNL33941.1 hypothetical protein [Flavobacteriaceae bacterium]
MNNLDNPFEYINKPLKDVPAELKERVMKDVAYAKLLMELASLFSLNVGSVIERTVVKRRENKK